MISWHTATGARALFLGDSEHDMREAVRAGAFAVGITGGYRPTSALRAAGAEHIVEALDDLLELIDGVPSRAAAGHWRDDRGNLRGNQTRRNGEGAGAVGGRSLARDAWRGRGLRGAQPS